MIGYLRGIIFEKHPNSVIIEACGVGYEVQIPISTYTALPDAGETVALRIHTHVREDALVLFGFATTEERSVFEKLITVSGIGPKLAVTILSGLPVGEFITAIRGSDIAKLVRIPGVGKKTAERLALELKDKLTAVHLAGRIPASQQQAGPALNELEQDVFSALQNLGCSTAAAEQAIRRVAEHGAPDSFEPFFRAAIALIR